MNYATYYTRSSYSTSTIVPYKIIADNKATHLPNKSNEVKLAPLVTFDENGDIPVPSIKRSTSYFVNHRPQQNAIRPSLHDFRTFKDFRKRFCHFLMPYLWSQLGLFVLVLGYIVLGGLMFYAIESKYEFRKVEQIKMKHLNGIHNIRRIATEEFNWMLNASFELRYALWRGMLSRLDGNDMVDWRVQVHTERFDRLIEEELARMQAEQEKLIDKGDSKTDTAFNKKWTFSTAMLYSATVITTVGYGNITPKSILGKLMTCLYAIIGIPLMIMYLANTGDILAFLFIKYYSMVSNIIDRIAKHRLGQQHKAKLQYEIENETIQHHVPISATVGVLIIYILAGAALFSHWEGWSYIDAAYFSFITFSTIGLGDLVPGKGTLADNKSGKSVFCALYLLYGLVLTTMCFKLLQEDLFIIKRRIFARLGFDNYHHYYQYHHYRDNRRHGERVTINVT